MRGVLGRAGLLLKMLTGLASRRFTEIPDACHAGLKAREVKEIQASCSAILQQLQKQ